MSFTTPRAGSADVQTLRDALQSAHDNRRRAECMAHIQTDAVQLALDLLVREPDIDGFFRVFMARVVEETESHACGVWLLNDDESRCELWMANIRGGTTRRRRPSGPSIALPRDSMAAHLHAYTARLDRDDRLRRRRRAPAGARSTRSTASTASTRSSSRRWRCRPQPRLGDAGRAAARRRARCTWRRALLEAMARQATLALHHHRVLEQSRMEVRRQAVLEERNRIARDIHDTLAQGFAAILMQLQAAQRAGGKDLPAAVATTLDTAVELARTHMIEARRSVSALRPQPAEQENVGAALERMTALAQRTSGLPVRVTVDELPPFGAGVEREIIGIAQEALTNAVRHSRGPVDHRQRRGRAVGRLPAVGGRRRPRLLRRQARQRLRHDQHARARRAHRRLADHRHGAARGTEVVLAWEPPSFSIPRPGDVAQ